VVAVPYREKGMQRLAAIGFILIGTLHMLMLGLDAWPQVPALLSGALWTPDHVVLAVGARDATLLQAEHAFWSTMGSAGPPLIFVGILIHWIDRRGLRVPPAASVVLVAWSALASLLMQPSGFPLVLFMSVLLLVAGLPGRARTTGEAA
jgi:hypothetical protein